MKDCSFRPAIIVADPVVATGSFVPGPALFVAFRVLVIHCAEDLALDDIADHGGGAVPVRRRGSIGRVLDEEADNGQGGVVCQFVLEGGSYLGCRTTSKC